MKRNAIRTHYRSSFSNSPTLPRFMINVDQRAGFSDLLNAAGWPANEISLLVKLQQSGDGDSALAKLLESGLIEMPTPAVDNSGKSNAEIIRSIIPKYVGTLSEYMKWIDSVPLSDAERKFMDAQAKALYPDDDDKSGDVSDGASGDATA